MTLIGINPAQIEGTNQDSIYIMTSTRPRAVSYYFHFYPGSFVSALTSDASESNHIHEIMTSSHASVSSAPNAARRQRTEEVREK